MKRLPMILLLSMMLLGIPTTATETSASSPSPTIDDIIYWTGSAADQASECVSYPEKDRLCVAEVQLDGRPLQYRSRAEIGNSDNNYIQVYGYPSYFRCWAVGWRTARPVISDGGDNNETCSYTQFHVSFQHQHRLTSDSIHPRLTVKIRKMKGTFPGTNLGFLHSVGPVHEFIPASGTNEQASVTISPGLTHGGQFNLSLHNYQPQMYASSQPRWSYNFFLASAKVAGPYDMNSGFEMLPESTGAWHATNAEQWGFYGDYRTPEHAIRIAGPHFQFKLNPADPDLLNTAWFESYMPRALVIRQFGITPEQANERNVQVMRSVGRTPTQLPSTFTSSEEGLLIRTDGITFSAPVISIQRRIATKRKGTVSIRGIINAAGIPVSERATARIHSHPCRSISKGCKRGTTKYTFNKRGAFSFTVSYRSRDARKRPVVRYSRVTVRVR